MFIPILSAIVVTIFLFAYTYVNNLVTEYLNKCKSEKEAKKKKKAKSKINSEVIDRTITVFIGLAFIGLILYFLTNVFGVILGLIIFFIILG
jgi:uncharacterized membrane protein